MSDIGMMSRKSLICIMLKPEISFRTTIPSLSRSRLSTRISTISEVSCSGKCLEIGMRNCWMSSLKRCPIVRYLPEDSSTSMFRIICYLGSLAFPKRESNFSLINCMRFTTSVGIYLQKSCAAFRDFVMNRCFQ